MSENTGYYTPGRMILLCVGLIIIFFGTYVILSNEDLDTDPTENLVSATEESNDAGGEEKTNLPPPENEDPLGLALMDQEIEVLLGTGASGEMIFDENFHFYLLIKQILKVIEEKSRYLSTQMDIKIIKMAKEYNNGALTANFFVAPEKSVMAYYCPRDSFAINKNRKLTMRHMMAVLYHELAHRVRCKEQMSELGFTTHSKMIRHMKLRTPQERCDAEKYGYAAEIRFQLAAQFSYSIPGVKQVNPNTNSHYRSKMLTKALHAFRADSFCEFYEENFQRHR